MKSSLVKAHEPCPCGKSSDAYALYDDGHGHCFSCNANFHPVKEDFPITKDPVGEWTYAPREWRGVSIDTMRTYKVDTRFLDGKPHSIGYPYQNGAIKVRALDKKEFWWNGPATEATLFGKNLFNAGGSRDITITEGELDALSAYQMLSGRHPVVSVPSSSQAKSVCRKEYDYFNSFDRIYLCLDGDEVGQKAALEVAAIFDFKKVFHVKLTKFKDANEFLQAGEVLQFRNAWDNARRFQPDDIVSSYKDIKELLTKKHSKSIGEYPFKEIQGMSYGFHEGEVVLVTAQEGIGKTEILRAMEHHLLRTTDFNIGILHLEEDTTRVVQGIATYELGIPAHLPDSNVSVEDILDAYESATRRDDRVHIFTHFGSDDPDAILERVRFLASACDCKFIFFDHISIVVSGLDDDNERKKLDYLSTRLKMLAKELDFCLILVSHVNDDGKTRGSRNISKVCDLRIDLSRDNVALNDHERNTTHLLVSKNRFAGKTGSAGKLFYDSVSGKLLNMETASDDGTPPNTPHESNHKLAF